jgi:transposase
MDDHSDDMRRPLPPRIEVYTGAVRKRWPDELKAQLVTESFAQGAVVAEVARRHGCRAQQLHAWRRMARLGQLVLPASMDAPGFVPLVVETPEPMAMESPKAAVITVEFLGARVEVRGAPGVAALSEVFGALRRARGC